MPNPELSQYHDHDTDLIYDLKDSTARTEIAELSSDFFKKIMAVCYMNNGGWPSGQEHSYFVFVFNLYWIGHFHHQQEGDCVRCIFPHFALADTHPDLPIALQWEFSASVNKQSYIYKDCEYTDYLKWKDVDNKVIDIVFEKNDEKFLVVSSPSLVNADAVLFDNTMSGLSAVNVKQALDELSAEKADLSDIPDPIEKITNTDIDTLLGE